MKSTPHTLAVALAIILAAIVGSTDAAVVADFDSMATGPTSAAALSSATTGGSWSVNTGRDPGLASIHDDAGDKALVLDDDNGGNSGTISFATLTLDSAADFATPDSIVAIDFTTAARRTGADKGLRYEFQAADGTLAAYFAWNNSGVVNLNGENAESGHPFDFLAAWDAADPDNRDVDISFADGMVALVFSNDTDTYTHTTSVLNGVTAIGRMQVFSQFSATSSKGVYLDDITITRTVATIPAPAALPAGLAVIGLLAFRRRRV